MLAKLGLKALSVKVHSYLRDCYIPSMIKGAHVLDTQES